MNLAAARSKKLAANRMALVAPTRLTVLEALFNEGWEDYYDGLFAIEYKGDEAAAYQRGWDAATAAR